MSWCGLAARRKQGGRCRVSRTDFLPENGPQVSVKISRGPPRVYKTGTRYDGASGTWMNNNSSQRGMCDERSDWMFYSEKMVLLPKLTSPLAPFPSTWSKRHFFRGSEDRRRHSWSRLR